MTLGQQKLFKKEINYNTTLTNIEAEKRFLYIARTCNS